MSAKPSIVILTSRGPRHSFFCWELAKYYDLRGIVVDDRYHFSDRLWTMLKLNQFNPFKILRSFYLKKQILPFEERDEATERRAFPMPEGRPEFPEGVPVLKAPDPNSESTQDWIRKIAPDILVAFGTRIIRPPVLGLAKYGALNIHTGLSPYYRGGQCTFWCLYTDDIDHIGVTIHHLSQKIDGGDIIYTAQPELEASDNVRSIDCKLIHLGTEKMIRAIQEVADGNAPRTPQREKGKLFLSKMFTLDKRLALEKKLASGWLGQKLREKRNVPV